MNPFEGDHEEFDHLKNFGLGAVDPDRLIRSVVDPIRNFINKGDAEPTDFSKSDKKYGDVVDHRSAQRIADKKAQQELDEQYSQLVDYYRHDDGTPYSSFTDDAMRDGLPKWMQQKALYSVQQEYADSQELAGGPVNGRSKQVLDHHLLDAGDSAFEDYENHLNRQAHVESSERKLNVLLPVFQNGVEGLSEDESKIYSVVSFIAEEEDVPVDHIYDNLGVFVQQYASMMGVKATTAMDLHAPMKQGLELQRKGVDSDVENYKAGRLAAIKGQALRAGINGITSDDKQRASDLFTTGHASIVDEYGEHLKLGGKLFQLYSNKKTKVSQSFENAGIDGSFSGYAKFAANPTMSALKLAVGLNQERDAEQYAMAETLASLPRAEAKKVMEVAMLMAEAEAGTMDDDFFTKFTESMVRGGTKYLNGIQDTIGRAADIGYSDEEATKRQRVRETLQDLGDIKDIHSEITSESKVIAGAYDMAASLPYMAAYATGVGGGLNALTMMTDADKELRKKYPDMSPTARWKVAVPTGLVNSGIETLQFKSWTRGFTSFSKSIGSNGIAGIAGLGLTRGVAQLATENLEESAQSLARPAIQWLWSKLGDDVSDVTRKDWDESFFIYDERTFFATLPLAVLGAGGRTTYDVVGAKQNDVFLSDVDRMRLYGISEDKAQAIAAQPDAMKKWLMFKDKKATISNEERETTIKEAISEGVLERIAKADDEASFKEYEQKILESGTANQKATLEVEKTEREYREKFDAKVSEEGDQFKITYPQTTGKPSEIFPTVEEAQTALHTHQVEVNEQFLEEIGTAAKNLEAMDLHKADLESLHKGAEVKLGEDSITMEDFAAQGEEQMKQALERIEHELLRMGTPREATVADLKNWKADGQVTLKREARGYVAKLSKGANIADLVEEGSEGFVRDLVQGGIVSSKWLKDQIFQYQLDTGNKMTKAKSAAEMSDQQMVEAFSDLAVANFWNAHSNDKLGAMGGIVNALRIFFNKVMQIANDLAKLGKEGKIDADFQTLLDNSVGLNMDQQIEDNVPKYQQEIIDENDTFSLQQVNKTSANDMADALGVARTIPAEYIGKKILPIMADHLGVGDADGVPMQGGAGHPLQNFGTGVGWRSKRGAIAGIYGYLKKRGGIWKDENGHEWALVTPFGMTQESHKSNKSTFFAYIKALENVNMSKAQKKALGEYIRLRADKEINSVKKKKLNVSRMQQFPLNWTKTQLDALTHDFSHDERAYLMDGLKLAGAKHLGVPDVQTVINQLRDDSYDKVNAGSMLSLLKVDVTRLKEGLKKDTENGLDASDFGVDEHLSYDTVLPAEIVTHLRQPIDMNVAFPDMIAKMKEVSPKSQPAYLLQAKLPAAVELQTLTPELVETINAEQGTEVTSIAKAKSYINALGDKWNVLEKGKMKGAANFIAAMERNEFKETLTPIDMDTLKADVKSGDLKVYGLDGFDVWFGIRNRTDGGKELVNVISNELSTGGMIDLVMMKAISEGVTHLDAYSVKSEKFPNGLLPTLYGRYGFKATSEDAYDKNYLGSTAKARNTKEKALKELWAKQGWDSSGQEMPSLVYMRYEQTAIQSQSDSSLSVVAGPLRQAGTTATESTSGDGGVSESRVDGGKSTGDAGGGRGTLPRRVDSFIDQLRSASPARLKAWQLDESERDQLVATHSTTFSISPAQDASYLSAVESGDMDKAQAMVDAKAKEAGYDSPKVYHGTDADDIVSFDPQKAGSRFGVTTKGYFFTDDKRMADFTSFPDNATRELRFSKEGKEAAQQRTVSAYLKTGKVLTRGDISNLQGFKKKTHFRSSEFYDDNVDVIESAVKTGGYNTVHIKSQEGDLYAVFSPNQIKSADPVTYDSDGNVIPLSQRFDAGRDEISFSITPTQDGVLQLKNGVTLEKQEARFDDRDTWLFKKEESTVGYLSVGTEFAEDRQTPRIIDIKIKDEARGQGLAREALPKLVKEYGVLSSDNTGKTSDDAKKMWESVGGREPNKNDTPSGDALFILKSDEITMSLTSSEDSLIDKLNAMMRDQDTRIEIYRNMTTRLNDVRQRIHTNKHTSDFITQNMAEMEAVVSVLPAELRHRAFSAKTLASKKTGKGASRYMVERLEYIDKILERFLKGELTEQVVKVINQSQPLAKSGGNQGPSKIGALGHEVAKAAKAAIFMTPMEAEKASALELSKLERFEEPTAQQTQEHGDVAYAYEVFADIKNADSTRLTVMLELLQTNWEEGRKQWLTELKDRKDWKEGKVDAILRGLNKIEKNDAETNKAQNKGQSWWANKARSLLSFYQVTDMLREGMGKDGSVIKEMADDLRRANGDFEMEQLLHKQKMKDAFAKIFGIGKTNRTARIQGRLNTIAKGVDRGDKLTTSKMYDFTVKSWGADIEKAKDMLRANPDRTDILLGKTPLTRDEFDEVYESYTLDVDAGFFDPTKKNKKYSIVLQRNTGERWNVGEKSQLDLANDWLAMQQTDLKDKYRKTGHDEQYVRELDEALDDDVKELALWMQNELRKSTPRTEALHRQEYGLLMATVQNYFPASFEHAQKGNDTVLAMDGIDVAGVGTKPSAHKMRINHASRPVRTNAVNAFNHHVMQNAYWNTHAEVLRKWGGVIRNKDVQDAILRSHGKGFLTQLLTQFEDYETQGAKVAAAQIASDRMWRGLTKGISLGVLGGRMTTVAKNMAAMMNVALGEDLGTLAKGLHPTEWKQDGAELWNSDTMQRRLKMGANVATRYALQGSPSGHVVLATATNAAEGAMQLINLADTGSNMMMTLAYTAKKRELRQTNQYTEAEIKALALDHVDDLMERYAQPTNRLSKSLAENTRHPMAQILVMFQSESRKMMSINGLAIRKILTGKGTQSKGMAAQQLAVQVILMGGFIHAVSAAYDAFVKGEGEGEDEGEKLLANLTDWKKLLSTMMADSLSGVPILGEGWSMSWKSIFDQKVFMSSSNPAIKPILGLQAFIKGAEDVGEDTASETVDKLLRATQALTGIFPQTAVLAQASTFSKDALGFLNNTLDTGFTEADTQNIYRKRIKDVIRRTGKEFAEDIENAENMGVKRGLEMERKALILERAREILFDIPEGKRKKFLMDQLQSDESGTIPKYIIRAYLTQ